jgi:hypothetical protein
MLKDEIYPVLSSSNRVGKRVDIALLQRSRLCSKPNGSIIGAWSSWGIDHRHPIYSPASAREPSAPSAKASLNSPEPATLSSRHVLPADLPNAIKQLSDQELDQLLTAVLDEQKRRGRKLPVSNKGKQRDNIAPMPLTVGRVNAVRAAFKVGITPSKIARQFGISQASVRKALASDPFK